MREVKEHDHRWGEEVPDPPTNDSGWRSKQYFRRVYKEIDGTVTLIVELELVQGKGMEFWKRV